MTMATSATSMTAFERVVDRIADVTGHHPKGGGRQRSARCPAHDDRRESLSVTDGNDRVLLKCHANCTNISICDALGLTLADLFNEQRDRDHNRNNGFALNSSRPRTVATYTYRDEQGKVLFAVDRREPKTFVCKRPDGGGGWIYREAMKGVRRVPYRLPELIAAVKEGKTVYIVEGEKDADRLTSLGHPATCNPHGAGKWRDEYAHHLTGAEVVVISDRDDTGRAHARAVVDSLRAAGAKTHLVEPAVGKDISDHLDSGRAIEEAVTVEPAEPTPPDPAVAEAEHAMSVQREVARLRISHEARESFNAEISAKTKERAAESPRVHDGASFLLDLPPTPPAVWGRDEDILWARGEALMIAGPQGVGKTTIAGQLLRGVLGLTPDVLGYPVQPSESRVLYLAMDRPEQARRALGRMFVNDVENVGREYLADILRFWAGPPPTDMAVAPETLVMLAKQHEADIVFVDSLKDAAVGLSKDEVGAGYNRARQLALAEGIQVVELHHTVKNGADGGKPNNINGVYGSTWLTSGCGSVVLLWGEPGDPVIDFVHLKQPMNEVGPLKVLHNRETGISEVYYDQDTDVVALARRCSSTGVSAREAAGCLYSTESPKPAEVEKARRKLKALVDQGLLVARPTSGGAGGRGNADRWFATAPSGWVEDDGEERYR